MNFHSATEMPESLNIWPQDHVSSGVLHESTAYLFNWEGETPAMVCLYVACEHVGCQNIRCFGAM